MPGLLYKELVIMKKDLLLCGAGIVLVSVLLFLPWGKWDMLNAASMTYVFGPMVTYFCIYIIISVAQSGIFAHDERRVWSAYITASPLLGNGQVLSKYYITLALSFTGVLWGFVCDNICMLTSGIYGSAASIYMTVFFVQIVLRAFELPFIIRFGEKHGRTYKILLISVAAFLGIVYLLFGKLPENLSLDGFFEFLLKLSRNEAVLSDIMLGITAVFPYAALLLYYLSYKISCKLYQKGVNTYDA